MTFPMISAESGKLVRPAVAVLLSILLAACAARAPQSQASADGGEAAKECRQQIAQHAFGTVESVCLPVIRKLWAQRESSAAFRLHSQVLAVMGSLATRRAELASQLARDPVDVGALTAAYVGLAQALSKDEEYRDAVAALDQALSLPLIKTAAAERSRAARMLIQILDVDLRQSDRALAVIQQEMNPAGANDLGLADLLSQHWRNQIDRAYADGKEPDPVWIANRWAALEQSVVAGKAKRVKHAALDCILPMTEAPMSFLHEGTVQVLVSVGPTPRTVVSVSQSSGYPRTDDAALVRARRIQCIPGQAAESFIQPFDMRPIGPAPK